MSKALEPEKLISSNVFSRVVNFLDFAESFDTDHEVHVNHKVLRKKLQAFGISTTPLEWFTGCVYIGKRHGSSLGPLLFLYDIIIGIPNSSEKLCQLSTLSLHFLRFSFSFYMYIVAYINFTLN